MKKVRKCDLEQLVKKYYCIFVKRIPIQHIRPEDDFKDIQVNVSSVYIDLECHDEFRNESDRKRFLEEFEAGITDISKENLFVTIYWYGKDSESCHTFIHIACEYEVLD